MSRITYCLVSFRKLDRQNLPKPRSKYMYIETVSEATQELCEALQRLIPQLSAHKVPPTFEELNALIQSEASTLLVARDPDQSGPVAGILCLTVYRVPTGLRSIIEDVIVDQSMRRRGIGEALMRHAIE